MTWTSTSALWRRARRAATAPLIRRLPAPDLAVEPAYEGRTYRRGRAIVRFEQDIFAEGHSCVSYLRQASSLQLRLNKRGGPQRDTLAA